MPTPACALHANCAAAIASSTFTTAQVSTVLACLPTSPARGQLSVCRNAPGARRRSRWSCHPGFKSGAREAPHFDFL
ncbi:hypothetical protein PsYK624_161350 [Phanerochaete sordida]|uniref:Uncharacterized protein n=1 Tax=Phanerochaete sordida TaxID=48140 RepID=A0A9P3GRJ8_9APHY|nr:hypothetical protein PsYK624_161350 [Phanerochaete sordida]